MPKCEHGLTSKECYVCASPKHGAKPERHFCERCGKRLSQDGIHTCTPPQQAEPVEPVAWRSENANPPGGYVIFQQYPQALADLGKQIQPLYAAPPQRKPLTQEQLYALYDEHATHQEEGPAMSGWFDFARAIERAHKIGDNT